MFEDGAALATGDLGSVVEALCRLDVRVDDAERVDQLGMLEQVKAAAAAAQARVTAAFVDSQAEAAQAWRARARECSAAGDFEGWRAAREQADRATFWPAEPAEPAEGRAGESGPGSRRRARVGRNGVSAQVALARRMSPAQGSQQVVFALRLVREMPHTLAALEAGLISEWRAMIIARETAELDPAHRRLVDVEIAGRLGARLGLLGNRELVRRVRAVAYQLDPGSVLARSARAQSERRVTIRPAPDTMAYLSALLPVAQAVAAHAALTAAADSARAMGDGRGKGQVMADELVMRVTGQARAQDVPVEVQLVMTDRALFAGDDRPAQLTGYGTVPAGWARELLAAPTDAAPAIPASSDVVTCEAVPSGAAVSGQAPTNPAVDARDSDGAVGEERAETGVHGDVEGSRARIWLRRLYSDPSGTELVAMDSARRTFDGGLRRYLVARDAATCRTPWCDAPVRHLDHVHDHALGGPTSADNGQGLCVRCNHLKQLPGWSAAIAPASRGGPAGQARRPVHTVVTTTPTGHQYASQAPPLLPGLTLDPRNRIELYLAQLLYVA
ncbi:HNH endonuclease signature motif containing protein [Intrasporangium mesophilum]